MRLWHVRHGARLGCRGGLGGLQGACLAAQIILIIQNWAGEMTHAHDGSLPPPNRTCGSHRAGSPWPSIEPSPACDCAPSSKTSLAALSWTPATSDVVVRWGLMAALTSKARCLQQASPSAEVTVTLTWLTLNEMHPHTHTPSASVLQCPLHVSPSGTDQKTFSLVVASA